MRSSNKTKHIFFSPEYLIVDGNKDNIFICLSRILDSDCSLTPSSGKIFPDIHLKKLTLGYSNPRVNGFWDYIVSRFTLLTLYPKLTTNPGNTYVEVSHRMKCETKCETS